MRVSFRDCVFDGAARELRRDGKRVALSPKAFELLALLIEERPRPLTQDALRDALWPKSHVGYTSLARVVSEVRRAVGDTVGKAEVIRTVPRFGYAFEAAAVAGPHDALGLEVCALVSDEREFPLGPGQAFIGRGAECAVRLASTQVSRVHARLAVTAGSVVLEDHDSKNGTWINGTRAKGPVPLEDGDELLFGTYRLVFRRSGASVSTRTAPV